MHFKIIYFYPDLMNLYGSYANILVLRRFLERAGHTVSVENVLPGKEIDLTDADFLYMGAGTEHAQKTALADFLRFGSKVKTAAENGTTMLFAGTAMELLGKTISDQEGRSYDGIGLAEFYSTQGNTRFVEDVYGQTALFPDPIVGFINKCSVISGVTTPLLTSLSMGFGNDGEHTPEGFHYKNVFASHLTGPILVKNPRLLDTVVSAIYQQRNEVFPTTLPQDSWAEAAYAVTAEQLRQRVR